MDPKNRMKIQEVLEHPWVRGSCGPSSSSSSSINNLQQQEQQQQQQQQQQIPLASPRAFSSSRGGLPTCAFNATLRAYHEIAAAAAAAGGKNFQLSAVNNAPLVKRRRNNKKRKRSSGSGASSSGGGLSGSDVTSPTPPPPLPAVAVDNGENFTEEKDLFGSVKKLCTRPSI